MIEDSTLVIGTLTQSALYEKTVSNMVECKSRGDYLKRLTTYSSYEKEKNAEFLRQIRTLQRRWRFFRFSCWGITYLLRRDWMWTSRGIWLRV